MITDTLDSCAGQIAYFVDGPKTEISVYLTLSGDRKYGFVIRLDGTSEYVDLGKEVTRCRLHIAHNLLLIKKWRAAGRAEDSKPIMLPITD